MKFSIIVPVYNREHTISSCLEGLLNTQHTDFEIILIDDGSADNSLNICKELAALHKEIKVYSQTNGGVSSARNKGIQVAQGEYIIFVDSDDTLLPNSLCEIEKSLDEAVDLLMFRASSCYPKDLKSRSVQYDRSSIISEGWNNSSALSYIFDDLDPYKFPFYTIWAKAFRRKIITDNHILFPINISLGEDQIFVCEFLKHTTSFRSVTCKFYCNLQWDITQRKWGLGSVNRTAQDYLNCQVANYKALEDLYKHSNKQSIKTYSVNYIFDRPITRIIYRNMSICNSKKVSLHELTDFIKENIKPIYIAELHNLSLIRQKRIKKCVQWIMLDSYRRLFLVSILIQTYLDAILTIKKGLNPLRRFLKR